MQVKDHWVSELRILLLIRYHNHDNNTATGLAQRTQLASQLTV